MTLATELLMKQFYTHLAEKEDKASALRHAKLDYLEKMGNRAPIYWAPFVLVGDGSVADQLLIMIPITLKQRTEVFANVEKTVAEENLCPRV